MTPQDRPAWLAMRRLGIGASEVGILFGCDPYRTPGELYAIKVGEMPYEETEEMRMGRRLEPMLLQLFVEDSGAREVGVAQTSVWDVEAPHLFATPDGWYIDDASGPQELTARVVETKATSEPEPRDGPPLRWQLQTMAQMACTGAQHGKIAALYQSTRFRIHDVPRREDVISAIRERVEWWWWTFVRKGRVPRDPARPLPDHVLDALYPREVPGKRVVLPPESVEWNDRAVELQKTITKATAHLEEYKCWLKEAMGDAEIGIVPGRDGYWRWKNKVVTPMVREAGMTREFRRMKR